jgi:hypothetical protein
MIIKDKVLVDFDKQPMRTNEGMIWTVRLVLMNACVQPSHPAAPIRSFEEHAQRYALAQQIHRTKDGDEIDIPADLLPKLREDVCRLYGTMIAFPMGTLLEGTAH